jgi:hypothetical protein
MAETHPIVQELRSRLRSGRLTDAERVVLELGKEYRPILRRGIFRLRANKQCFYNAGEYAGRGPEYGNYVEGYAAYVDQPLFHHAWLSLDGETAIDVTLRDPKKYVYFGIEIPTYLVSKLLLRRGHFGVLDPFDPSLVDELRAIRSI